MHHIVIEKDDKTIPLIKSIIDEAMEKKDRTVSVYIHGDTMSVSVTPLGADEPRWIIKKEDEESGYFHRIRFECPICGYQNYTPSRYCPNCGEALKIVNDEETNDDH